MRPANDFQRKPAGPLGGFWSWQYLNLWKTLKLVTSKRVKSFYARFPEIFPPGEPFPDFELRDIHGNAHRMSDYLGKKYIVLTSGAITWPPYRRQVPFYEELQKKYAGHDVVVFNLYVREPHAGERGFPGIENHKSYEHKLGYARDLARIKGMEAHILVDEMDQKVHETLGNLPNFVYLVGRDGRVAYKCTWSDAEQVDEYLARLVNEDPALADRPRVEHTIFTAHAGTQI